MSAALDALAAEPSLRDILGVSVAALGWDEALDLVAGHVTRGDFLRLGWLNANNANIMRERPDYRAVLDRFLILPDGVGVDIASLILHGRPFPANLNGTDFAPALIRHVAMPMRVALIGAKREVAEQAAADFAGMSPRHEFRVIMDGFYSKAAEPAVLDAIAAYRPHLLLVCMGVPRQELFIAQKITPAHCTVAVAAGALFDLHTGAIPRAAPWMRGLRLEWLARLWHEPTRLWRRYILGNPIFLARVAAQRLTGRITRHPQAADSHDPSR